MFKLAAGHKHKPKAQVAPYAENAVKRIGDAGWSCQGKIRFKGESMPVKAIQTATNAIDHDKAAQAKSKAKDYIGETRQRMNPITLRWEDVA